MYPVPVFTSTLYLISTPISITNITVKYTHIILVLFNHINQFPFFQIIKHILLLYFHDKY